MNYASPIVVEPIVREIRYGDPADFAARLQGCRNLTFLDSAMRHKQLGRYSYLACEPFAVIDDIDPSPPRSGGRRWREAPDEGAVQLVLAESLQAAPPPHPTLSRRSAGERGHISASVEPVTLAGVRDLLSRYRLANIDGLPPFQGGLAGFLAYELGGLIERGARLPDFGGTFPKLMLNAYDVVLAVDHQIGRAWIISSGFPEIDPAKRQARALARIDELKSRLSRPIPEPGLRRIHGFASNYTREAYERAVARTVEYILAGDIFQANISQRFAAPIPQSFDPYAFYRHLRQVNAATFAAYLDYGDIKIASSSPERLIAYDGRQAEARPIKGTVRRDPDAQADAALIAELLSSRKDRAENVMIVDLLRNDLSRVCKPGTVQVPVLCGLESYAAVHHLTSVVTGELRPDKDRVDLIAACFPGGSITGAPKIRAMEIIAETERSPRNIYCGSIGFIGFNGMMDLNICIRTAMFHGGVATFQGGGGITAKSDPAAEYDETLAKVQRIQAAFAS